MKLQDRLSWHPLQRRCAQEALVSGFLNWLMLCESEELLLRKCPVRDPHWRGGLPWKSVGGPLAPGWTVTEPLSTEAPGPLPPESVCPTQGFCFDLPTRPPLRPRLCFDPGSDRPPWTLWDPALCHTRPRTETLTPDPCPLQGFLAGTRDWMFRSEMCPCRLVVTRRFLPWLAIFSHHQLPQTSFLSL